MSVIQRLVTKGKDWAFGKMHGGNLIYNTCWEDPRCDREIMQFDGDSNIVMITSAGCNALDYALDKPKAVHCIDMNFRQNSVLELKKAFYRVSNFEELFKYFGDGGTDKAAAENIYKNTLRPSLPKYAQEYWDEKFTKYFTPSSLKSTFYFHGTSGTFAWLFGKYIRMHKNLEEQIQAVLNAKTLEEQKERYDKIEGRLLNNFLKWAMKQQATLNLLGIPESQAKLVQDEYPDGIPGFIQDALRHIFTELPIGENYFWQLYANGKYTKECCPNYLVEKNFEILKEQESKVHTYTMTISEFLIQNPAPYTHYILLDHQDWLAANNIPALEEEWELILKNSQPGTKILMRSGAMKIDFFPDFVLEKVTFDMDLAKEQHPKDRVGTYTSVYIGTVN